jgi:curli production assembly/transport component CsgE
MSKLLILAAVLCACGVPLSLSAQEEGPIEERYTTADGIKGLIVNQTITTGGYEFFRSFTEFWRQRPEAENYSLNIIERPSKRYGNQIWIFFGQTRVYAGIVPLKYDRIRTVSEEAVDATIANLVAMSLETPASGDPDVGKNEL